MQTKTTKPATVREAMKAAGYEPLKTVHVALIVRGGR